jgi:hypothetical protein
MNKAETLEVNREPTNQDGKRQKRYASCLRLERETIRTLSGAMKVQSNLKAGGGTNKN